MNPPKLFTKEISATVVQEANSRNWFHYQLFLRQDFEACNVALESHDANASSGTGSYGLFLQGLIAKRQGRLMEALVVMKQFFALNPKNLSGVNELISLSYLTCSYNEALQYAQVAKKLQPIETNQTSVYQGLCYEKLGNLEMAEEYLKSAIQLQPIEKSYVTLIDFYLRQISKTKAVEILDRAKRLFPDSISLARRLASLQMENTRETELAFGNLAQAAATTKSRDNSVLLALGCMMQKQKDVDGALRKYETITQINSSPLTAALLNNIGLCYHTKLKILGKKPMSEEEHKQRILLTVGCLKKAHQLSPFDWRIAGNLGYVMRDLRLFASASYYLMASIRLAGKNSPINSYLMLAGVANNLEIPSQANQLYKYCMKFNSEKDPCVYLNYASFLCENGEVDNAAEIGGECQQAVQEWQTAGRIVDQTILNGLEVLKSKVTLTETSSRSVSIGKEFLVAAQIESAGTNV